MKKWISRKNLLKNSSYKRSFHFFPQTADRKAEKVNDRPEATKRRFSGAAEGRKNFIFWSPASPKWAKNEKIFKIFFQVENSTIFDIPEILGWSKQNRRFWMSHRPKIAKTTNTKVTFFVDHARLPMAIKRLTESLAVALCALICWSASFYIYKYIYNKKRKNWNGWRKKLKIKIGKKINKNKN